MQGRALTPDVILSGNLSVSKTVNLQNKIIYHNGQYEADDGYDGLGKVTVDVHNEMTDLKATENGVYLPPEGYDGFDLVDVDVPDPELDTIHITQNGRYAPPTGVYGYDDIYVDVHLNLESKTITSNGHYEPSQGKNGFSDVTVNVPERVPVIESKSITENGTYTAPTGVDGYSPITVNVPLPANAYLLKELSNLPQPIASFNDGADAVMQSLKVDIEPLQSGSGDPSPTNVRPISGWSGANVSVCGKNLFDKTATDTSKGFISGKWINQTGNTFSYSEWNVSEYIRVDGERIAVSGMTVAEQVSSGIGGYCCYDKYKNVLGGGIYNALTQIITLPTNTEYIRISVWNANKDVCQLELSETATAYEPYNGHTYTIDLDGTRYGGTLDVVNGVLVVDEIFGEFDGVDENWNNIGAGSVGNRSNALVNAFPSTDIDTDFVTICNTYIGRSYNNRTFNATNIVWVNPNGSLTVVTDSDIDTAEKFKALLQNTPLQVIAKLATPLTIQLTPTSIKSLEGENNVSASTGDVTECEYFTPVQ